MVKRRWSEVPLDMMVGGGLFGGASFGCIDPTEERHCPPEATPVTFAPYHERKATNWEEDNPPPDFYRLFSRVTKQSDVVQSHLDALNIATRPPCPIDDLLPLRPDGKSYIPPVVLNGQHSTKPSPKARRGEWEGSEYYMDTLDELQVGNGLAYQIVTRAIPNKPPTPRLTYMRAFFGGLENMSRYWDVSRDDYYEVEDPYGEKQSNAKRQKREDSGSPEASAGADRQHWSKPSDDPPQSTNDSRDRGEPSANGSEEQGTSSLYCASSKPFSNDTDDITPTPEPEEISRRRYKGRRSSTGDQMPASYRIDTAKHFLGGIAHRFPNVALFPPRLQPQIHFGNLNIPVRQNGAVYCLHRDLDLARKGHIEGPVLGLLVRSETRFVDEDGTVDESKCRLDAVREICALLQLAQERRREGQTHMQPGEGKWWATTPRWGGGEGGEVPCFATVQNGDDVSDADQQLSAREARDVDRRMREWRELKRGRGSWDPRTAYRAVGKDPVSEVDEVFLLSCVNHHMALLKLTVHSAYVDSLVQGELPKSRPEDPDWCRPVLQRTEWLDLFDVQQRDVLFRGLWGVMTYLLRNEKGEEESE